MTVQTFLGAADIAVRGRDQKLLDHQAKVNCKKGVNWAGLDSMRVLEVERALRYSFEKAVLRDRELGRGSK
jgi:pyrroline-5-carboxylate reductase